MNAVIKNRFISMLVESEILLNISDLVHHQKYDSFFISSFALRTMFAEIQNGERSVKDFEKNMRHLVSLLPQEGILRQEILFENGERRTFILEVFAEENKWYKPIISIWLPFEREECINELAESYYHARIKEHRNRQKNRNVTLMQSL